MRVITGLAKGKRLVTREGTDVRPTTERVKEALFSILQFDLEGRRILDLFAGSGQLGIEALSRGAASAVFVDSSSQSIKVIQQNLLNTGLGQNAQVVCSDFASYLAGNTGTFDIVFLDPPYRKGLLEQALPLVAPRLNAGGSLVCEHPKGTELPPEAGPLTRVRTYSYGQVWISLYRGEAL